MDHFEKVCILIPGELGKTHEMLVHLLDMVSFFFFFFFSFLLF